MKAISVKVTDICVQFSCGNLSENTHAHAHAHARARAHAHTHTHTFMWPL